MKEERQFVLNLEEEVIERLKEVSDMLEMDLEDFR